MRLAPGPHTSLHEYAWDVHAPHARALSQRREQPDQAQLRARKPIAAGTRRLSLCSNQTWRLLPFPPDMEFMRQIDARTISQRDPGRGDFVARLRRWESATHDAAGVHRGGGPRIRGDSPLYRWWRTAVGAWQVPRPTIAIMIARSRCTPLDTGADSCCSAASSRSSSKLMVVVDPVPPTDGSNHEEETPGLGCARAWSRW